MGQPATQQRPPEDAPSVIIPKGWTVRINGQHNIGKVAVFPDGGTWELVWTKRIAGTRKLPELVIPQGWSAKKHGEFTLDGQVVPECIYLDGGFPFPGEGRWILAFRKTGGKGTTR